MGDQGTCTLRMIHELGLADKVIKIPKTAPAATNRFIYYQNQLNKLPSSLLGALRSDAPILRGVIPSVLKEPFVRDSGPTSKEDESIHDFLIRRFGPQVAEIVSAVIRGIYAGDTKTLSVRSTLRFLWESERQHGSVLRGLVAPKKKVAAKNESGLSKGFVVEGEPDKATIEFVQSVKKCSVFSLQDGIQTLSDALVADLGKNPNVTISTGTECNGLHFEDDGDGSNVKLSIRDSSGRHRLLAADHVISALPANTLASVLPSESPLAHDLSSIPFVDVAVVNFAFKGNVLPVEGFGYLIPSSEPADILGAVFDSCATTNSSGVDKDADTRLTVMMGGYMFRDKFGHPDTVSKDNLKKIALESLKKHLGIQHTPVAERVTVQQACIPQYVVGHHAKLQRMHEALADRYPGKLSVVGASYMGVGINDCVLHAREVALGVAGVLTGDEKRVITGLNRAVDE
ncbi:hypothetical protein HK102_004840 [Quaeritorhiza haematococci]|nr:hypothetical protein HK102_004840 [Quaeritorhiza haematococci]